MDNFLKKKVKFDDHTSHMTTINRLLGLRIIEYPEGKPRPLITMFYLIFIWSSCTATLALDEWFEGRKKQIRLERIYFMFLYYVSVFNIILLGIMGCYYSETFVAYRKKIAQIDESLDKLQQFPIYSDIIVRTTIITVFSFLHVFLSYGVYLKNAFKETDTTSALYTAMTHFYGSNISSIVLFEFTIFASWIDLRYQKTNNVLKSFARDGFDIKTKAVNTIDRIAKVTANVRSKFPKRLNNWMQSQYVYSEHGTLMSDNRIKVKEVMDCKRRRYLLQATRLLHLELCNATKMLCTIFNVQITFLTLLGMLFTTAIIYYVYLEMKTTNKTVLDTMSHIIMPLIDCIAYGFKICLLGRICMSAEKEASTTVELIHACAESEDDCEARKEIRQFALQIAHIKSGLVDRGFFRINFVFIRERLNSIVTFVLIMIQMSQELKDPTPTPQKLVNATLT